MQMPQEEARRLTANWLNIMVITATVLAVLMAPVFFVVTMRLFDRDDPRTAREQVSVEPNQGVEDARRNSKLALNL